MFYVISTIWSFVFKQTDVTGLKRNNSSTFKCIMTHLRAPDLYLYGSRSEADPKGNKCSF